MYARSTTWRGNPAAIDELLAFARDEVLPAATALDGCLGLSLMADRASGRAIGATSWTSEEAMRASAAAIKGNRDRAGEILGDPDPEIREWEVAVMHRRREAPSEGAGARVTWIRGDPDLMDDAIRTYRANVVPAIEQWYGFCSVSVFVDRNEGLAVVSVVYESTDALERSRAQAMAMRDQVTTETGTDVLEAAEFDLLLHHLRVPETV